MLGPNITSNTVWPVGADGQASWLPSSYGALGCSLSGTSSTAQKEGVGGDVHLQLNANVSNAIYGKASGVQPKSLNIQYLIKY